MTRWARVSTSNSKRPLSATSWEDMKKGSVERADRNLPDRKHCPRGGLSLRNDAPQAKHKKNKKKKEYLNEDVNGFMEYLKQSSQVLHNGQLLAADSQEVREEIAVALKKDRRREGRRLKRQAAKKNAMVRSWLCVSTVDNPATAWLTVRLSWRVRTWARAFVTAAGPRSTR